MKLVRNIVVGLALVSLLGACSCKTRGVGSNIGDGQDGPLKSIYFSFDSATITPESKETLKANAAWLEENDDAKVQIEGHCDERGTQEYNLALGERRAKAAHDALRALGVKASRLSTVSYGEEMPRDPAHNEAAWAKNRRAQFAVSE